MFGLSTIRGAAVIGAAITAVALGWCPPAPAHADTFIPLPGGAVTRTLGDGSVVHMRIDGESAKISGAMAATPLHRNVWATAHAVADVEHAARTTIKMSPGYIVGCQVDLSSLDNGGTASGSVPATGGAPAAEAGADTTLTLGPGQARMVRLLDLEMPDDFNTDIHRNYNQVSGPHASVSWQDETFAVDGCGGYAQARSFVSAEISTGHARAMVTVWGAPFSMG
ncbi:MAG: MspA family porin [Nocardia sp.]|nr:MspA family porin [Nocardia sp.]